MMIGFKTVITSTVLLLICALAFTFAGGCKASSVEGAGNASKRVLITESVGDIPAVIAVNEDGTSRSQLVKGMLAGPPAGGRMAYVDYRDTSLYVSLIDGSNPVKIAANINMLASGEVALSPDGLQVAYVIRGADFSDDGTLNIANTDGTGHRLLSTIVHSHSSPSFSPDSHRVAFIGKDYQIYVINADGTGQTSIGSVGEAGSLYSVDGIIPRWAHDANRVVFATMSFPSILTYSLTNHRTDTLMTALYPLRDPSWDPDDNRIAVSSMKNLMVVDASGNVLQTLSSVDGNIYDPQWSSDGHRILYRTEGDWFGPVSVVDLATGSVVTLSHSAVNCYWL